MSETDPIAEKLTELARTNNWQDDWEGLMKLMRLAYKLGVEDAIKVLQEIKS